MVPICQEVKPFFFEISILKFHLTECLRTRSKELLHDIQQACGWHPATLPWLQTRALSKRLVLVRWHNPANCTPYHSNT